MSLSVRRCVGVLLCAVVVAAGCTSAPPPPPTTFIVADSFGVPAYSWARSMPCSVTVDARGGWGLTTPNKFQPLPFDELASWWDRVAAGDRVVVALGYNDLPGSEDLAAARSRIEARARARGAVVLWATIWPTAATYPFPAVRDHVDRRRGEWRRGLVDPVRVGDPFEPLLPAWAVADDGVHATPDGQAAAAFAAADRVCP